jgi:PIN domain nuclease of toxin-antitoxin system
VSSSILDASAVIALIDNEPGADQVAGAIQAGAAMSAINVAEVVSKLSERGFSPEAIGDAVAAFAFERIDFDTTLALEAGLLRAPTRHLGLSLGDRACLALARRLGLPAITADRNWARASVGVTVQVIH